MYKLINLYRSSRLVRWSTQSLLMIVLFVLIQLWQTRNLRVGQAPASRLTSLEGEIIDIKDNKNKPTLLYFFAPWCSICKISASSIADLNQEHANANIYAIALAYKSKKNVEDFAKLKLKGVKTLLGNNDTSVLYKIEAFPTIYILGKDNKIETATLGYTSKIGLKFRLLML